MVDVGVDAWLAIVVIRFTRVSAMVGGSCAIRLATWSCNGFLVREKKNDQHIVSSSGNKTKQRQVGLMRMYLPWTGSVGR